MAKYRGPRTTIPGGKTEDVAASRVRDEDDDTTAPVIEQEEESREDETVEEEVKGLGGQIVTIDLAGKNQLERALLHLEFLEQELRSLVDDKSAVVRPMRQTAAKMRQQFNGDVSIWPPIKTIKSLLAEVQRQTAQS